MKTSEKENIEKKLGFGIYANYQGDKIAPSGWKAYATRHIEGDLYEGHIVFLRGKWNLPLIRPLKPNTDFGPLCQFYFLNDIFFRSKEEYLNQTIDHSKMIKRSTKEWFQSRKTTN